jgi:hypothetical protein
VPPKLPPAAESISSSPRRGLQPPVTLPSAVDAADDPESELEEQEQEEDEKEEHREIDPDSAATKAAARATAASAKHSQKPDEELAQAWTEIAGSTGTLSKEDLRKVFQRLGRQMSEQVRCASHT